MSVVETKVAAATTAGGTSAAASTVILYLLDQIHAVANMPDPVKSSLACLFLAGVTSASTFVAGYLAPHTHRPDLVEPSVPVAVPVPTEDTQSQDQQDNPEDQPATQDMGDHQQSYNKKQHRSQQTKH